MPKVPEKVQEPERRRIGYPHGAFERDGRWIPNGAKDYAVEEVMRDLLWVRRHVDLSPAAYLERLAKYKRSQMAVELIGRVALGQMSNYGEIDDWGPFSAQCDGVLTDAGAWIVHCGSPLRGHRWDGRGKWVQIDGTPSWRTEITRKEHE